MSLQETISNLKSEELFTVRGDISFPKSEFVKITFEEDVFAIVAEKDIQSNSVFPISPGDDPSGRDSGFLLKLRKNAEVELNYKSLSISFFLNFESQRQFYICPEEEKIVYIDQLSTGDLETSQWINCYKRVYVVDCYCCRNNRFRRACYGWVGCPNPGEDGWYDERCCP